jgi:nucleoside-diphosphate-sugar epimerase
LLDVNSVEDAERRVRRRSVMTEARGASNEKAKRDLGWQLRYPSLRQGFAQGLG